jgi:deoxycytidylate deaminase
MNKKLITRVVETARELADFTQANQRHFSFIVIRNKIICSGINRRDKTHPTANKFNYYKNNIHSELAAILNWPSHNKDLRSTSMINVRLSYNGDIMLSKPCSFCQRLLASFNFNEVYYSNDIGDFVKL